MRGVQSFAARPQLRLHPDSFNLVQDGAFVLGGELPALRFGRDLRVGSASRRDGSGSGVGNSSAPVGLAMVALSMLRNSRLGRLVLYDLDIANEFFLRLRQ